MYLYSRPCHCFKGVSDEEKLYQGHGCDEERADCEDVVSHEETEIVKPDVVKSNSIDKSGDDNG